MLYIYVDKRVEEFLFIYTRTFNYFEKKDLNINLIKTEIESVFKRKSKLQ